MVFFLYILQFIYLLSKPNGTMELYQFVMIFGSLILLLAQMPSFHSLRHINLVSLWLCLVYCACTTAGAIYIGNNLTHHSITSLIKSYLGPPIFSTHHSMIFVLQDLYTSPICYVLIMEIICSIWSQKLFCMWLCGTRLKVMHKWRSHLFTNYNVII